MTTLIFIAGYLVIGMLVTITIERNNNEGLGGMPGETPFSAFVAITWPIVLPIWGLMLAIRGLDRLINRIHP